jgi:hypothetical protein
MCHGHGCAFRTLAVLAALALPAVAQSVISTHSGIVHFFEGAVYLGDQPLESHPGRFSSIPTGAELRTADGRAEVLLTPSVFLRLGERSTIRMIANELSDTRVELLSGSAVVDTAEPTPRTSVTLIYSNWSVRFPERGQYRIDCDPARLWVLQGKAEVSTQANVKPISVGQGMSLPFAPVLVPDRTVDQPRDALRIWAEGRQQSISTDNAIAANIQDPATMDTSNADVDNFTYFPILGLFSLGTGLYSSSGQYQPGFNSIYLPGYTYPPLFVGLGLGGYPTPVHPPPFRLPPTRIPHGGVLPFGVPRGPIAHPTPMHPMPMHSVPAHAVSGSGMHVGGGHR